jgi:hypothetical protein
MAFTIRAADTQHWTGKALSRSPQEPDGKFAEYTQATPTTGMLTALCPSCASIMNKVVRRADLEAIRAKIEVAVQQANPRLVSLPAPPLK